MLRLSQGQTRATVPAPAQVWSGLRRHALLCGCLAAAAALLLLCHALAGCAENGTPACAWPGFDPADARRVLVVANRADTSSLRLADLYALARGVPDDRRMDVDAPRSEGISLEEYRDNIETPVRMHLEATGLRDSIDFILLIRGVPLVVRDTGTSVDALLAAMDLDLPLVRGRDPDDLVRLRNPYFRRTGPFRSREYGYFLVTRLDGYTRQDAESLIGNAARALPHVGPFLLDQDPAYRSEGYRVMNDALSDAAEILRSRGLDVVFDSTAAFAAGPGPLAGYCSWGSNHAGFSEQTYRELRFLPGAIAETFVSTSGRTFRPRGGGQSLVADLVAAGVTGAAAYVTEPFTIALCRPDILFDRYVGGRTLAESFYAAMPLLKWKTVVIGDPICSPYRRLGPFVRGEREAAHKAGR